MSNTAPVTDPVSVGTFLAGIKPPAVLNFDSNIAADWPIWKQQWANYVVVSRLDGQSPQYQTAMLLNSIGTDALKVFNGFVFVDEPIAVDSIIRKFDDHIIGQLNETYERYKFNSRKQNTDESIDTYVTALRALAKNCNFCQCMGDTLLRDRMIMGICDSDTRKRLPQTPKLSVEHCIDVCRAHEATEKRLKSMEGSTLNVEVHSVKHSRPGRHPPHAVKGRRPVGPPRKSEEPQNKCFFCATAHEMRKESCPAGGKTCSSCNGRNHFAVCCRKKGRVHGVDAECHRDSEYELLNVVTAINNVQSTSTKPLIYAHMIINDETVKFQVDCGASVNLISTRYIGNAALSPPTKILQMWDQTLLAPIGECRVKMINPANERKYAVLFTVVNEDLMPVLGATASQRVGLITVNRENIRQVTAKRDILDQYKDVFNDELGHFRGEVHLEVDPTIQPVITPARKVPFDLNPLLKDDLDRMTAKEIIVPVTEPTEWVSA